MGGPVAAAAGAPHTVKTHGSELEYAIRGQPELAAWARESLAGAEAVFVGSEHIREVLEEVVGQVERVHEVPPGVDVDEFRPRAARAGARRAARGVPPRPAQPGQPGGAPPVRGERRAARGVLRGARPVVVYVGKLLYNKGVHVLFEALRGLDARGLIVGFGDYREELEAIAPPNVLFTGALEHRHLVHLLPLCDVEVVPSIFPEAFGMVAAEAAAAGVPPLVARHSGWPRSRRGWRSGTRRSTATSRVRERQRGRAAGQARGAARAAGAERRELGRAARNGRRARAGAGPASPGALDPFG